MHVYKFIAINMHLKVGEGEDFHLQMAKHHHEVEWECLLCQQVLEE
jgi:hypothetical protein